MYSLYQSPIRKTLQIDIYKKQYGFVNLFWKDYFYLIKEKKIWPFKFREFQIMGLQIPEDNWNMVRKELKKLKKQFWKNRWNIFFQLGIVNEITDITAYYVGLTDQSDTVDEWGFEPNMYQ